jgi:rubrerythrin
LANGKSIQGKEYYSSLRVKYRKTTRTEVIQLAIISDPFVANKTKNFTNEELMQALRVDITGEYEAIIGYEAHAACATDERVKKILYHIADEERRHVGELQELLYMLSPKDAQNIEQGRSKINQMQQSNFQAQLQ